MNEDTFYFRDITYFMTEGIIRFLGTFILEQVSEIMADMIY